MSFRTLLMSGIAAAAVAVSVAPAAADSYSAESVKSVQATKPPAGAGATQENIVLAAGSYVLSLAWDSVSYWNRFFSPAVGQAQLGVYLLDGANVVQSLKTNLKTTAAGALESETFNVAAGTYSLQLAALQTNMASGASGKTFTVSGASYAVSAVPGPLAAAGLPGLAGLLGFGLYRRARRAA